MGNSKWAEQKRASEMLWCRQNKSQECFLFFGLSVLRAHCSPKWGEPPSGPSAVFNYNKAQRNTK